MQKCFETIIVAVLKIAMLQNRLENIYRISLLITMFALICMKIVHSDTKVIANALSTYTFSNDESPGQIPFQRANKNRSFSMGNIKICSNSIPVPKPCDPDYPYRYPDGTCNNLDNPSWCSSFEPYQRFLPANYAGSEDFRRSIKGGPLPDARRISLNINEQRSRAAKTTSNMFPIFGQLVAHDISSAIQPIEPECCGADMGNNSLCAVISPGPDDPYYSEFNVTCLDLKRTNKFVECNSDVRQQQNTVTGSIDASTTYGFRKEDALKIKESGGTGKLRTVSIGGEDLLPYNETPNQTFCLPEKPRTCFASGDTRVNQHATLAGMETLFMREHNRIVPILKDLNPSWDGEKLYLETRKIVGGVMQCIVYKEYLPLLLGQEAMDNFGLSISKSGVATRYDPKVQCGVWTSYAQAIGRLHSMVGAQLGVKNIRFKDTAGNSQLLRHGFMKNLLQGVCRVASEKNDRFSVRDMKDHLYVFPDVPFGIDLVAGDILRGRDHGVPSYVDILSFCKGRNLNITQFHELLPYMEWKNIRLLEQNYKDVRDVDLWVAFQMERHIVGTPLGPTAICILGRQFRVLKYGDRFFFEHEGEVPSFTAAQREELKQKCSLSRILCDSNHQKEQQRQAFLMPSFINPILSCDQLAQVDLRLWKENPTASKKLCSKAM